MSLNSNDVADYLASHPEFFNEHQDLLADVSLVSPHGQRAVSLQERQMELLRDKVRSLELRMAQLIRFGQENDAIGERINRLVRQLFLERNTVMLPEVLLTELKRVFVLPSAALRIWGVAVGADQGYAREVSTEAKIFINSLMSPYCGPNSGFEPVGWLEEEDRVGSVAMIPLRSGSTPEAFGLLVLGSPDPGRFTSDMGITYLARIDEIASAALSRLLK
ncbi:DUF484 family protein [soil metagenome]